MKKIFFIIITIVLLLVAVISYWIYVYKANIIATEKNNKIYLECYNKEIPWNELISLINKTIDTNEKNEVNKDEKGYYIDNKKNSIQIDVIVKYKDETKVLKMEDISKNGSEAFVKVFVTVNFKCTSIEFHEKTKNVKKLIFEEI